MNFSNCRLKAVADIYGGSNAPGLWGRVKLYQMPDHVYIQVCIHGLPLTKSGFFGFHIHEGKSCGGIDFADTLTHYNPDASLHPRHAGDLPPLIFCNGGASQSFTTDRFRLKDVLGRTIVIHDNADDFTTQPAGNAGTKIACGIIKRV